MPESLSTAAVLLQTQLSRVKTALTYYSTQCAFVLIFLCSTSCVEGMNPQLLDLVFV